MRRVCRPLALVLTLGMASAALAQDDDDRVFPDDYDMANKGFAGMNAALTAPADPIAFAIQGPETFPDVWAPAFTGRVLGLGAGLLQMPYRATTGLIDVATFPLAPWMPMISPPPRFKALPHYHEEE